MRAARELKRKWMTDAQFLELLKWAREAPRPRKFALMHDSEPCPLCGKCRVLYTEVNLDELRVFNRSMIEFHEPGCEHFGRDFKIDVLPECPITTLWGQELLNAVRIDVERGLKPLPLASES
jgi:transposase